MVSYLLYTKDFSKAKQEIEDLAGRVTHRFSDSTIVVNFPTFVDFLNLKNLFSTPQQELDKNEEIFKDAWEKLKSGPSHAPCPLVFTSPCACGEKDVFNFNSGGNFIPDSGISPALINRRMKAEVALILVVVSGTSAQGDNYKNDEDKILQEVIKGADFLANAEPRAKVTFR